MKGGLVYTKEKEIGKLMARDFGITNVMAQPRIKKVVLSVGTGSKMDKRKKEFVLERLSQIAGQKAVSRAAKKAIATFKTRQGDPLGAMVTLRGAHMYAFLDKLIHIALPRLRDFKGISPKAIDKEGNITIGVPEHAIFPETAEDDLRDAFGFAVTIVSTAKGKDVAHAFFKELGIPFREA